MHVLQRLRLVLIVALLLSGSSIAFGQAADPVREALTALTTNIGATDDAGFQRATEIMLNALQSIAPDRDQYGTDCFVWGQPSEQAPKAYSLLSVAFLAAATQERIYGDPGLALYRAWLNVIKCYDRYRKVGSMPEYPAIERLEKLEQSGQLRAQAESVQAKHPALFDRIVLGPGHERFAREHAWSGCGVISLEVPETWTLSERSTGDLTYTFTLAPKNKAKAAMTVTFSQHRRRTADAKEALRSILETFIKATAVFANEKRPKYEPMDVHGARGLAVRLSGDDIVAKPPVNSLYRNVEVVALALDDHCDLYAVKQMDQVGSPESADMDTILQSAALQRTGPPAIVEVKEEFVDFSITSPASQLRLVVPNREFSNYTPVGDYMGVVPELRYFDLVDRGDGLEVSGWFESAARFKGFAQFWEEENRGNRLNAKRVEIVKVGDWDAVLFDNQEAIASRRTGTYEAGTITHLRAEYVRHGTWIDLHCSLSRIGSSDKSRKALLKFLKQVKVEPVNAK